MIRSMTGFGQGGRIAAGFRIQIDLKSVNHRYAEILVRMPREWLYLEDSIKKLVQQEVRRGRVDVFITVERDGESGQVVEPDWELIRGYMDTAAQIRGTLGLKDELSLRDLLQIPGVVRFRNAEGEDKEQAESELLSCAKEAVEQLAAMRQTEGAHLLQDLRRRLTVLREYHRQLQAYAPKVAEEYRERLHARIAELLGTIPVDEARLETEVALFADRSNVDEEITRLESHFEQFEKLLDTGEPMGRKLDFLIQEMNREVNTVGSKANQKELTGLVVDMKAELEKIREQVQNIE